MTVDKELHSLIDDLLGDRPASSLAAYRRLTEDHLPWLERRAVLHARRQAMSWAGIGRVLGRSRQAAMQRFAREFRPDELLAPVKQPLLGDDYQRGLEASIDRVHRQLRLEQMEADDAIVAW